MEKNNDNKLIQYIPWYTNHVTQCENELCWGSGRGVVGGGGGGGGVRVDVNAMLGGVGVGSVNCCDRV